MPVLVLLSSRSMLGPVWSDAMLRADVVLDVRALAVRAVSLGNSITVERIDGGLHEVFLSAVEVRRDAYHRLERWLRGYGPAGTS
jgi:alpha-beta hydrolase superfamily lysophospholipase